MSDRSEDAALAAVIDDSRAGAESVERGHFRLDWERALDKIKRFQLTDAHRYVLELVQAAVASGATRIDVTTDSDDVILDFDGPPYSEPELTRLFDYLFAQQLELVRLKELALGVNAALALEPKFIVVDSGDGKQGFRLRLTSHRDLRVERLSGDAIPRGTRIHVRDRTSWHVVSDLVRGNCAEARLIADNCPYAPIPITVDGEDVRRPLVAPALARHAFSSGGIRGELLLPDAPRQESRLEICMGGVRVVTFEDTGWRWLGAVGVVGWVDNPLLSRNASHSDVHHDRQFDRALAQVRNGTRDLLRQWLRATLLDPDGVVVPDLAERSFTVVERHYLQLAARAVLGRRRRKELPAELEALLDVPGLIELAVTRRTSSLRRFYEAAQTGGRVAAARDCYDLALDDLPPDLLPARGPGWLLEELFGAKLEWVDEELAQIAAGVRNRRLRERNRREPEVSRDDVIVKIPIADPELKLRGELGLGRDDHLVLTTATWLALNVGIPAVDLEPDEEGCLCVFLRDGVFLSCHRITAKLLCGVASLDCPQLTANAAWDDVVRDKVYDRVVEAIADAIPELLRALVETVAELPPPRQMRKAGYWTADAGVRKLLPPQAFTRWSDDTLAVRARDHADAILARHRKLDRDEAPWLYRWPMFHLLDGTPISIDELEACAGPVGYVVNQPWGEGGPDDTTVVDLWGPQRKVLNRYVANIRSVTKELTRWRKLQSRMAGQRARHDQNYATAESRRQPPRLDPLRYPAIVDLALADGEGQVGIPDSLAGQSAIRYLVDGVPLCDLEYDCPIPVHAVAQGKEIRADALFEKLVSRKPAATVERAVANALPALVAAFVDTSAADGKPGRELVWRYLESIKAGGRSQLDELPGALTDFPLVPSVAHGPRSLRQVQEDAANNGDSFLRTQLSAFRQLSPRPILVTGEQRAKVLARLLAVKAIDYTRSLETELTTLGRLDQPRRPAVLTASMAVIRPVAGDDVSGQIGIPSELAAAPKVGYQTGWVDLMRKGFVLERVPLEVDGLPFAAVVECPALTPTPQWDGAARDPVFERTLAAVRDAADELIVAACADVASRGDTKRAAVAFALRQTCGQRFRGRPSLDLEGELETELAAAPIWGSATGLNDHVTLAQISDQWRRTGAVWVVEDELGHVSPSHLIVRRRARDTTTPLTEIFGAAVVSGSRVLRNDEAAYQRRQAAPSLVPELDPTLALHPVSIHHHDPELELELAGQVALYREYRSADRELLQLRIGVEGKQLCQLSVDAPLRGLGVLDCRGLRTNRDWDGIADQHQRSLIEQLSLAALWSSLELIEDQLVALAPGVTEHAELRAILIEALIALADSSDQHPELRDRLMAAPLFRTVQGRSISGRELADAVAANGRLLVVDRVADEGNPGDGRLIVRAGETALAALTALWGKAVVRHDEAWRTELAGQRRRRAAPRVAPRLDGEVICQAYFQDGSSSGIAGLLRPGLGDHDDASDSPSRLRLHVDYRKLVERQVDWHPASEIWLNDDTLQPNPAFDDVVDDDAHRHALAVAEAQIVELVARAAERWRTESAGALRPRLENYVVTRLPELVAGAERNRGGPEARLLAAPLWPCSNAEGQLVASTIAVALAHERGELAVVGEDQRGRPADPHRLVVRASDQERGWLTERFGDLPDYSEQLSRDDATRRFDARPEVAAVNLSATDRHAMFLLRRPLTTPGCEGEIGLVARPGRRLIIDLFWRHRSLSARTLEAPVEAVVAVQCATLTVNDHFTDVSTDHACMQFLDAMRAELHAALIELAARLDGLPADARAAAHRISIDALARDRARQGGDPLPAEVRAALEQAPLLSDLTGRALSIAEARERTGKDELAAVSSETAQLGAPLEERLVLVIDSPDDWRALAELLPVTRWDSRLVEAAEGRRRMEAAPDHFELSPRRTLVRAPVTGPMTGEVGLGLPPGPGWLVLFGHGRRVEKRSFPGYVGLVGHLGGELETDRGFQSVLLDREQSRAIEGLYQERLAAAVDQARQYRGSRRSRTWSALCHYTVLYLTQALAALGDNLDQRRDRMLRADPELDPRLVAAARTPILCVNDRKWIDLVTAIAGESPTVVLTDERLRKPPPGATVLVGDVDTLRAMLAKVLPRRQVVAHQEFVAARREKAKRRVAERERRRHTAARSLLSAVRSTLRSVLDGRPRGELEISAVNRIELVARGRGDLIELGSDGALTLNESHAVWKSAIRLETAGERATHYLAMAILADLARGERGPVALDELIAMARAIGAKATPRAG